MASNDRTKQILSIMHILAWLAFIGIMIQAGATVSTYVVSCINPEAVKYMYLDLHLSTLQQFSFWQYSLTVSFMVAELGMKAYVSYLVIMTLWKVNLVHPFTIGVARRLEKISRILLGTAIVAVLNNAHADWLVKRTGIVVDEMVTAELLFTAGLVFIISQIFRRGVELQSEHDLTV